jgi:hypothetical protein
MTICTVPVALSNMKIFPLNDAIMLDFIDEIQAHVLLPLQGNL